MDEHRYGQEPRQLGASGRCSLGRNASRQVAFAFPLALSGIRRGLTPQSRERLARTRKSPLTYNLRSLTMDPQSSAEDLSGGFLPSMLAEAARQQAPAFPWLPNELLQCTGGSWESRAYVAYVSRIRPNQPGSEWQFQANVVLEHTELGTAVIDVLKGNRLGGIELVDRIEI